jgi:hypothetical protein
MYVAHLEFLADKGAEIEMAARSRFLGSRLGVLDRDAPLDFRQFVSAQLCVTLLFASTIITRLFHCLNFFQYLLQPPQDSFQC